MDLKNARKDAANKGKQVISLMEQMECLHVTNSNRKKRETILRQFGCDKKIELMRPRNNYNDKENKNRLRSVDESESEYDDDDDSKPITKINGIDFLKQIDNLSRLTVVKLRYYVDKNKINVGRVKKAELVKIIKSDLEKHFNL